MKKHNIKIKLIYYLMMSFIIISILLIITEYIYRATGDYPISAFVYDQDMIWRLKRNHREIKRQNGNELKITFNQDGFRGRNHKLNKDEHTVRIMVLGDSYTFGGIDYSDEQIFTSLLETKLNQNNSQSQSIKYEVMNISVSAWATDQQLNYLIKEGVKYHPDYLILMVAPNDIRESYCKKIYELTENITYHF